MTESTPLGTSPDFAEPSRLGVWVSIGLLGTAIIAGCGWFGYRNGLGGMPDLDLSASTIAKIRSEQADSKPESIASASRNGFANSTDPIIESRDPIGSNNWPFWEFKFRQPIPPRDPPLTPLPWRIVGSTQSGGQWSLLVLRQGQTSLEYYKPGDRLPGGYEIKEVTEEDVTLAQGQKLIILSYIGTR